jgi:hypothetical protein
VFLSLGTLLWQLFVLVVCSSGLGLIFLFLLPQQLPVLTKTVLCGIAGFFVVILLAQNLFYLCIPIRISAWLILAAALAQFWRSRRKLTHRITAFLTNADTRMLSAVVLSTLIFHAVVPARQGLQWYYGKGHFDQLNYVLLAEFLRDQPYNTDTKTMGLNPWMVGPVGFHETAARQTSSGSLPGLESIGLKKERIGQSIITAQMSVWSNTNAKAAYAATVIFFLTLLAACLYLFLRQTGGDRWVAALGALTAAVLPALTQLSLEGFLSQTSVLFLFPFLAILFQHRDFSPRAITFLSCLTLAYFISAYSELAPLGFCTVFLALLFIRTDPIDTKRRILFALIPLILIINPFYLPNLIQFVAYQYHLAAGAPSLWDNIGPNLLTLPGWSNLIFGTIAIPPLNQIFTPAILLLGVLAIAGALFLSQRDKLILASIFFPSLLLVLYLLSRKPPSYYPVAKITLTLLPLALGLVFIAFQQTSRRHRYQKLIGVLLGAILLVCAGAGSFGYYCEVLNNQGMLTIFREPRFLEVSNKLEDLTGKKVLVFEAQPLLAAWLCYHARHNDTYFDGTLISDSAVPPNLPFANIPALENLDFVVTRDQLINLKTPGVAYLSFIDSQAEDRSNNQTRYWLGPPALLHFLTFHSMSATLKMRLAPSPQTVVLPVNYFLADAQGHRSQGELWKKDIEILPINLPKGLSYLVLSVAAQEREPSKEKFFPVVAELEAIKLSDITPTPD